MDKVEVKKIKPDERHLVEAWVKAINNNFEIQWVLAEAISVNNYFNPPAKVGHGVFPVKHEETKQISWEFTPQDSFSLSKNIVTVCFLLLSGDDSYTGWARFQEALIVIYNPINGLFNSN